MLRALSEYYNYLCKQENSPLSPKGFSKVSVNYNIILKSDGTLKDIIPYTQTVTRGKKEVQAPIEEIFPFRYSVSATSAETIDHREKYNFGLVWDKKENKFICDTKSKLAFDKNKEKNLDFLEDLNSPVINAYKLFLSTWTPENETENPILLTLDKDYANAKFVVSLEYENDFLHNEDLIKEKWCEQFFKVVINENEKTVQCSISGKETPISQIPKTHTKLKGINGGLATGVGIVSFNAEAFCSYNKEQSSNSFVSNEIMEKYTEAFNFLSSSMEHKQSMDDMTLLYWAMTEKDEKPYINGFNLCMGFNNSEKLNTAKTQGNLESALKNLSMGLKPDFATLNIDENVQFYILGVKPNTSRLSIKMFEHNSFGELLKSIGEHHLDMQFNENDRALALWQIQKEMKSPVANNAINPALNVKLLQSILKGIPYPRFLLDSLIYRVKTDKDQKGFIAINRNRVRIIRACLIRLNKIEREATKMLNKENKDSAYNLGRLFAVIEMVQTAALPGINATIKDRFFSSACSTPYLVFPRLIKLSQNHFAKLEGGKKVYYEKFVQETLGNLEDNFPKSFNMEQQGMFILGYYQQREDFFTKKTTEEKGE